MSGTYTDQAGNIYASTYGKVRTYSPGATYTTYNPSTAPYQGVAYPTQPTTYSTSYPTQPQTYQMYSNPAATSNPTYGETLAGCKPVTGEALDVPGQKSSASKPGKMPFHSFHRRRFDNCFILYGCPKSHCAKDQAYCSACDHLIRKISSGMFQKSSSFEEFNGFGEIDVHFFE